MKIVEGHLRLSASDLSNFLACRHLTQLDVLAAEGHLKPARTYDIGFDKLIERGEDHERLVLERFRADGLSVVDIAGAADGEAATATRHAFASGADVIYQGVLLRAAAGDQPALLGRPDFLVRADIMATAERPRAVGAAYEVVDAKLARSAKARAVLQTTCQWLAGVG